MSDDTNALDPAAVIARVHPYVSTDRPYHAELPPELARWHVFVPDGGHSIVILLSEQQYPRRAASDLADYTVPAPVKSVLRQGWTTHPHGYVLCDLPYDQSLGLVTDYNDDEF